MLNQFWHAWRNEYLISLREVHDSQFKQKRSTVNVPPSVGDVVLIKDNLPRGTWKLGSITEVHQSIDGKIRSATV